MSSWLPPGPSRRWRRRRRLALGLLLPALLAAGGWRLGQVLLPYGPVPATAPGTRIVDRWGNTLLETVADDGQWREPVAAATHNDHAGAFPAVLEEAVTVIEDRHFHQHAGVNWLAAARALGQNGQAGRVVSGASTITMQVERLRHPRPRNLGAKLIESFRAGQIEDRQDKNAILTEWLERAPFGRNVVGARAAARRWFGKDLAACSLAELALLAGIPQRPNGHRPDLHPENAQLRRDRILDALYENGSISHSDWAAAKAEPVSDHWHAPVQNHQDSGARATLLALAHQHRGSLLHTTLDRGLQRTVDALASSGDHYGADATAVVVAEVASGAIRAVSSWTEGRPSLVDFSRRRRASGSTLKPFVYGLAMDRGLIGPDTLLVDGARNWQGWRPANDDQEHRGWMSAAEALASSRNLPAVDLAQRLGLEAVLGTLRAHGFEAASQGSGIGLGAVIGSLPVSPRELAGAYVALVNDGRSRPLQMLARHGGGPEEQPQPILRPRSTQGVLASLSERQRTAAIDGRAAELGVAWKTGTSAGNRDAWCAAASPRFVVVVWRGRRDGRGVEGLSGTSAAAHLALAVLAAIDPGGPGFPEPSADRAAPERLIPQAQPLVIAAPAEGSVLHRLRPDSAIPLVTSGGTGPYRWFVDDRPISLPWLPTAGSHRLRVVDGAGVSRSVTVVIAP